MAALDGEVVRRALKRRDANEPAVIAALEAAGAAVQQLDGDGLPDLLVSWRGVLTLLEVKDHDGGVATRSSHRGKGNTLEGDMAALTPSQVRWWGSWKGKPPVIVRSPAEALLAIARCQLGHRADVCDCSFRR